jgi:hypothetical protein
MMEQNVTCIMPQCLLLALSCTVYALCGLPTVQMLKTVSMTETDSTLTVWQRETDAIVYALQCLCSALQQTC